MVFQQIIEKINSKPRLLFLIDAFGALVSAISLGLILTNMEATFGMPRNVLHLLALIASILASYSFSCYFRNIKNWRLFLKGIAIANLIYCCITIGLLFHFFPKITNLGLIYFVLEVIIIISLASIEWKTASK